MIHARGNRVQHSSVLADQAASVRTQVGKKGENLTGGEIFRLTAAERADLPDWLKLAANWQAKKLPVKPTGVLTLKERDKAGKTSEGFF